MGTGEKRAGFAFLGSLVAHLHVRQLEDRDNESEEPDGAAEDLDDEDLDEESRIGGVGESSSRAYPNVMILNN